MAYLFGEGKFQAFNSVGAPLAGGKLYSYTAGTTTPKATYTTQTGGTANANPVVLDAYGRAQVWLGSGSYRMILKDASDATIWDVDSVTGPLSAGDLTDTSDATLGAGIPGFAWALNYAASTVGWGIKGSGTDYNILRDITPSEWAAVLDGTTTVDHSTILQTRIDAMAASTGGTIYIPGTLLCNTPIVLKATVSLRGNGDQQGMSKIKKNSTTTKATTVVAGATVVYPTAIPASQNAIIVLTDNGTATGRYNGRISDLHLEGTFTTAGNYETQKVEFGIVSVGSVSESSFERLTITGCQYGMIFPSIFASYINRVTFVFCFSGLGIDNGTSTNVTSCYANYCRDWGYYIRDHKYSLISGNACDSLNDPVKFPTSRARECSAYRIRSALGLIVCGNGDEQTYGNSYYLQTFTASEMFGNLSVGIGSDYTGAEEIAWIKSDSAMDASSIFDNHAYDVKSGGLTYGGAVAGQHHNIYAATPTSCLPRRFDNNVVSASRTTMTVETGWGNNSLHPRSQQTTVTAATYSQLATDTAIIADRAAGTVTLTLLDPAYMVGQELLVRTIQNQTVVSASSNVVPLIGGSASTGICAGTAGTWARLKSDGTNWLIVAA